MKSFALIIFFSALVTCLKFALGPSPRASALVTGRPSGQGMPIGDPIDEKILE